MAFKTFEKLCNLRLVSIAYEGRSSLSETEDVQELFAGLVSSGDLGWPQIRRKESQNSFGSHRLEDSVSPKISALLDMLQRHGWKVLPVQNCATFTVEFIDNFPSEGVVF